MDTTPLANTKMPNVKNRNVRTIAALLAIATLSTAVRATEFIVATNGNDANPGTTQAPFRTIQHAANIAQPGDAITVHEGVYRERVNPPRGGTSDGKRITYQAAPGEKVVITGSEPMNGWLKVTNDTWRVTMPNSFFGTFNPYADRIHGDWCGNPGGYHTGAVYLNGDWLTETTSFGDVLRPSGETGLWYAKVAGIETGTDYLLNVESLTIEKRGIAADTFAAKSGDLRAAPCAEGGNCVGWIRAGNWLKFDQVNLSGATHVQFRAASVTGGGDIELHLGRPDGELLGDCAVADTGDWQKWVTFSAEIKPIGGEQSLFLVFQPHKCEESKDTNTTIWAQFPGVNPNHANVEINVRRTVFTPSKTGINYITVRGFELRDAAAPWAPPTAAQIGIISAFWCKGWVIENNKICYSPCSGVALGKYGDNWDNRAQSAEGYVGTIHRALSNGWNKATVGSHLVRNNEISHCEQTGVVGSLGCSFSTVTGNEIHDIHIRNLYGGAEMAGIKFHGAIDVTISHNHIYRCSLGLWLDWMAQGAHVTGNLFHDNSSDFFFEMQHGPILVANNLFLSKRATLNSQGVAFVHNLFTGSIFNGRHDQRSTPFMLAHSTKLAGLYCSTNGDSGDHRFYNNLFVAPSDQHSMDGSMLRCFAAGDVFTRATQPSKFDSFPLVKPLLTPRAEGEALSISRFGIHALIKPDFDPVIKLVQRSDGWYLTINEDNAWRDEAQCKLVTTRLLGKAKVSRCAYENADGSRIRVNTDYFGEKRNEKRPFPGPFETISAGPQEIKVWPLPTASALNE